MTELTAVAAGTPIWVDLSTRDIDGAVAFYTGLFGWDVVEVPGGMGYRMLMLDGQSAAGLGPVMMDGQPSAWSTYIAVDDANAFVAAAEAAGATVLAPPMAVNEAGTMAVVLDPTGAAVSVWQANQMRGAEVSNVPNSWCWNELNTRDAVAATAFYSRLFRWQPSIADGPVAYTEWQLDGHSVAGMMPIGPGVPAEVPAHWLTYFAVGDIDQSLARATELGATVVVPIVDAPVGRFAVVTDPTGASLGLIQLAG